MMKLLLTSAGLTNQSIIKTLEELVAKPFSEATLAFIPTAANVESGDKEWLIEDLYNCKKQGFASVDIVDISALPQDVWLPRLQASDIIFVGGGNTFHLIYWMKKSGLKEFLPKMLERKVYVGISAGSMVACPSLDLDRSAKFYSEEIGEHKIDEGFGWVDFMIRPHLNSPYFPNVTLKNLEEISKEAALTFYAIDDNTAIKVVEGQVSVISEGEWKKFN